MIFCNVPKPPQIIPDVHYVLLLITGWMSMVIMDDICGTISSRECNKTADASHYRYILHGIHYTVQQINLLKVSLQIC